jgi:hypothetical protein
MKVVISESRLEDIVFKYISKTIGEYRELHGEERYSPPPFKSSLEYYAGFYKDGEYTAIVTGSIMVITRDYYKTLLKLFSMTIGQADRYLLNYVNQYDLHQEIKRVSLFDN